MKKLKRILILFLCCFCFVSYNIKADDKVTVNVSTYVDSESPKDEKNEYVHAPVELPDPRLRSGLTVPTEGVYDKIVDTKNASGLITVREYFYKGVRVERRVYTGTNTSVCRMSIKYLYYSDGTTVERHRKYHVGGATCLSDETNTFRVNRTLIQNTIFKKSTTDNTIIETNRYNDNGKDLLVRSFLTSGVLKTRHYYTGVNPNRITHVSNYNVAGTEWIKSTYYHDYNKGILQQVTLYTGKTPNMVTVKTIYDEYGEKAYQQQFDDKGLLTRTKYYEDDELVREVVNHLNTNKKNWESTYVDELRDVLTYFDLDEKTTRQIRYFDNGVNPRWDSNYVEGKKDSVKLYDSQSYSLSKTYNYTEGDIVLDGYLASDFAYTERNYNVVFANDNMAKHIADKVKIDPDKVVYIEDFKLIDTLSINNLNAPITNLDEEYQEDNYRLNGIQYLTELKTLKVNHGSISMIPLELSFLKKLEVLDLAHNEIEDIASEINKMDTLKQIDLSSNKISSIDYFFKNMQQLEKINYENNYISSLDDEVLIDDHNTNIVITKEMLGIKNISNELLNKYLNNVKLKDSEGNPFLKFDTSNIYNFERSAIDNEFVLNEHSLIEALLSQSTYSKIEIFETASSDNTKLFESENESNYNFILNDELTNLENGTYQVNIQIISDSIIYNCSITINIAEEFEVDNETIPEETPESDNYILISNRYENILDSDGNIEIEQINTPETQQEIEEEIQETKELENSLNEANSGGSGNVNIMDKDRPDKISYSVGKSSKKSVNDFIRWRKENHLTYPGGKSISKYVSKFKQTGTVSTTAGGKVSKAKIGATLSMTLTREKSYEKQYIWECEYKDKINGKPYTGCQEMLYLNSTRKYYHIYKKVCKYDWKKGKYVCKSTKIQSNGSADEPRDQAINNSTTAISCKYVNYKIYKGNNAKKCYSKQHW